MGSQMGDRSGRKYMDLLLEQLGLKITLHKEDGLREYKGKSACNPACKRSKDL